MNSSDDGMKGRLESHPGKTERDWLLEERCRSNEDKKALSELLEDAKVTAKLSESKSKGITDYEVKRLLKIVDSELYALYPEYKKSALL